MEGLTLVTLGGLADGSAEELFQAAMKQVLENIEDPNTDWRSKRKISLSFTVTPDEERRAGKVEIACGVKLAGVKQISTYIAIGRHEGQLAAVEALKQEEMFPQPAGRPRPAAVQE